MKITIRYEHEQGVDTFTTQRKFHSDGLLFSKRYLELLVNNRLIVADHDLIISEVSKVKNLAELEALKRKIGLKE